MKCVRITMGPAAVAIIAMNTVTSAGMSTAMMKRAAAAKLILMKGMDTMPAVVKNMSTTMNMVMEKAVAVGNIITRNTMIAADMNIITATMFRGTRRTVSAKYAIRMRNTAMCAAKALKTAPAACRTLTA